VAEAVLLALVKPDKVRQLEMVEQGWLRQLLVLL
jgi:hypothetical protein